MVTQADLYTLRKVPPKPGHHNGYWKWKVGMMTKVTLKKDWIYVSHTCVKLIDAYKKIRDEYIKINRISQNDSDNAPFFLRGSGLDGLDLKNLCNRWKEAGYLNYERGTKTPRSGGWRAPTPSS